jgi:hypothetical protein
MVPGIDLTSGTPRLGSCLGVWQSTISCTFIVEVFMVHNATDCPLVSGKAGTEALGRILSSRISFLDESGGPVKIVHISLPGAVSSAWDILQRCELFMAQCSSWCWFVFWWLAKNPKVESTFDEGATTRVAAEPQFPVSDEYHAEVITSTLGISLTGAASLLPQLHVFYKISIST